MLPDDSIEPDTDKVFPLRTSSTLISFRSEGSDLAITWNPPLFISVNGSIDHQLEYLLILNQCLVF